MVIKLGSNIASLNAQRRLTEAGSILSGTYERLSSGQRINRASDDAAGLAISDDLKVKNRIYSQAIRNGNDGISLLTIADSAIEALTSVVVRIRELSEQAANGTYSDQQKEALDAEAQQLSKEFTRIIQTTKFNGIKLFDGSLGQGLRLQLGNGIDESIKASIGGNIAKGTFSPQAQYSATNYSISSTLLADLNNDGIMDIVAGGAETSIRLGNGDGTFRSASIINDQPYPNIAVGDLNGDGILDLMTVGSTESFTVSFGNGDGTFGASTTYDSGFGGQAFTASLADLDNDGVLDLITAGYNGSLEYGLLVKLGNGDGSFAGTVLYSSSQVNITNLSIGDFNGDGRLDVVSALYSGDVHISLGDGAGGFSSSAVYTMQNSGSPSLNLADINGDGILDIAAGGAANHIAIRLGNSNGTFGNLISYSVDSGGGYITNIQFGDINGDGLTDITASINDTFITGIGNGDGSFKSPTIYNPTGSQISSLNLADFNSDGYLDLVLSSNGSNGLLVSMLGEGQSGIGALASFSLKESQSALQSMRILDNSLQTLAKQRGIIGASMSRISIALSNLQTARESYSMAESRIRDADIAQESSSLIRAQILQQSASAVLAQANQSPALALKLLN